MANPLSLISLNRSLIRQLTLRTSTFLQDSRIWDRFRILLITSRHLPRSTWWVFPTWITMVTTTLLCHLKTYLGTDNKMTKTCSGCLTTPQCRRNKSKWHHLFILIHPCRKYHCLFKNNRYFNQIFTKVTPQLHQAVTSLSLKFPSITRFQLSPKLSGLSNSSPQWSPSR